MYRHVVTINDDGSISVEKIIDKQVEPKVHYDNIDDLPKDIAENLKQLMWVGEKDATYLLNVGTRLGKNLFWVC